MKKLLYLLLMTLFSFKLFASVNIDKIEPPFWYAGMKSQELQLFVYGQNIGEASVLVNYPGISLSSTVRLESNNYLIVYLHIDPTVKPCTFPITFSIGKKKVVKEYELKAREKAGNERMGFDASDALYLLMPDRFANGNPENDNLSGLSPYKVDRNNPNARHGGDLAGIAKNMDYFKDLGVTALWFTPVLENDMEGGSYHGYATTDYYKVDPRFGTNEEYKELIKKAHDNDLKIVMDMIFNHNGLEHPWLKDMPSKDFFNNPDHESNFKQTSFKLTPLVDPYRSQYDFDQMVNGWFVPTMPDLNQKNPHVYNYLKQNSMWWIEYADIDGIRMDTYPYADYDAMSDWMAELNEEYPNFNTVGETWVTEPAYTAWWQKDSKLSEPKNSNLKSVMDFSFFDKINIAKNEQTETWFKGLDRVYSNFVYDYLYPDPSHVLAFIENHDTDRFLGEGQDLPMLKQAATILLTTKRIPQLYYGTEIMMNGVKAKSDGYVRKDFPGGWNDDTASALTAEGRTPLQNESFDFFKTLLNWRKGNDIIAKGEMVQFMPQNGVYAYARQYDGKTVFVMLNGTDSETTIPLSFYKEVLEGHTSGTDVLTGKKVGLSDQLTMAPRASLVIEL